MLRELLRCKFFSVNSLIFKPWKCFIWTATLNNLMKIRLCFYYLIKRSQPWNEKTQDFSEVSRSFPGSDLILVHVFLFLVFASLVDHGLLCLPPVFHVLSLSLVPFTITLLPGVPSWSLPTCVLFSHQSCVFKPSCFLSSWSVSVHVRCHIHVRVRVSVNVRVHIMFTLFCCTSPVCSWVFLVVPVYS